MFDGPAPKIKETTVTKRKELKQQALNKSDKTGIQQSSTITQEQLNDMKYICALHGISYIQSQGEADVDCAQLYIDGIVDYVLSGDCDIIVFGAGKLIRNFRAKKNAKYELINMYFSKIKHDFINENGVIQIKNRLDKISDSIYRIMRFSFINDLQEKKKFC